MSLCLDRQRLSQVFDTARLYVCRFLSAMMPSDRYNYADRKFIG